MNELPEVLTAPQVAKWLQVSPDHVRNMTNAGVIPGKKIGKMWRYSRVQLLAWMDGASDE